MKLFKRKRQKATRERHKQEKSKSCVQLNANDLLANNRRKRDEHLKSLRNIRTIDKDSNKLTHSRATRAERENHLKSLRDCRTLAEVGYPEVRYHSLSNDGTETSSTNDYSDSSSIENSLDRGLYLRKTKSLTESSCSRDSTTERRIPRPLPDSSCSQDSTVETRSVDRYSSVHHPPSHVNEDSLTCLADQISFQSNDYWYDSKTKNWWTYINYMWKMYQLERVCL